MAKITEHGKKDLKEAKLRHTDDDHAELNARAQALAKKQAKRAKDLDASDSWKPKGNPNFDDIPKAASEADRKGAKNLRAYIGEKMAMMTLAAASRYGYDGTGWGGAEGYLTMIAQRFPTLFCTDFFGQLMPKNVTIEQTITHGGRDPEAAYETLEELRRDLAEKNIPLDELFATEDPPLLLEDRRIEDDE
jgi:hypothetical protein